MKIVNNIKELTVLVEQFKENGKTIGFVPTMGALHKGHLSLVQQCLHDCDICVVSIFVNPTQFNNLDDLERYPKNIEEDSKMLMDEGCHILFAPSVQEMYPEKDTRIFDFDGIETVMEGEHRPGHFNGVAQIVSKLFDAVKAHKAYFGRKDFQQVAIIKKMVNKLNYNIEIVACDIVRELDGLAMSSRNMLLTPEHRKVAPLIYKGLEKVALMNLPLSDKKKETLRVINAEPLLSVEYFDIVDSETLQSVDSRKEGRKYIGCIAVWADKVRLIDNIIFN